MATIHKEILINAAAETVWEAARDVGALHTRLVPGFVTGTTMKPDADPPVRVVTFANGNVLDEVIVDCDDTQRRLVWAAQSEHIRHHNGAFQVFPIDADACRAVWIADILPHALAEVYAPAMAAGLQAMKAHFERDNA
jgi:hypothetical protein